MTTAIDTAASVNASTQKAGRSSFAQGAHFKGASILGKEGLSSNMDFMGLMMARIEPGTELMNLNGQNLSLNAEQTATINDILHALNAQAGTQAGENAGDLQTGDLASAQGTDALLEKNSLDNALALQEMGFDVEGLNAQETNDLMNVLVTFDIVKMNASGELSLNANVDLSALQGKNLPFVGALVKHPLLQNNNSLNTQNTSLGQTTDADMMAAQNSFNLLGDAPVYEWRSSATLNAGNPLAAAHMAASNASDMGMMNSVLAAQIKHAGDINTNVNNGMLGTGEFALNSDEWSLMPQGETADDFLNNSDSMVFDHLNAAKNALKNSTSAQQFASHLAHAKGPSFAHPATEQVSMQLQKNIEGQLQKMTLQLDPASMGKVDIELSFGEDGAVHTKITAEKQETLDILKQDSQTLEKLLEDAGLQTSDNGLEFDLRQQQAFQNNNDFNNNNGTNNDFDAALAGHDGTGENHATETLIQISANAILSADHVDILV